MDRSTLESALIFIGFVAMCVLAYLLDIDKLNNRYTHGSHPSTKSNRLPFRFSLKALLIAMTLAAIGTALVTYALR
jgi:hypothetical protein